MTHREDTKVIKYMECTKCEKNNYDDLDFLGCPRWSCEVETKGTIILTKKLNKLEF